MRKPVPKANLLLVVLVGVCLALASYVGVRGVLTGGAGGPDLSEEARKKEFEAAMAEGNLSFEEAKYWRVLETAESAGSAEAGP